MKITPIFILPFIAGCTVGPDYKPIKIDLASTWTEDSPLIESSSLYEIDQAWWLNFKDPKLHELISIAIENNLDIKIALSRIKEARAQHLGSIANQLPEIDLSSSAKHVKNSSNIFGISPGRSYDALNVGFDASWEIDIFGGKRALEAAYATLESTEEAARDVIVSLIAEVAFNYISFRNYQNQISTSEQNLIAQRNTYELTKSRNQAGLVNDIDVKQSETLVHSTESSIPTLRIAMKQSLHSLEVLINKNPGTLTVLNNEIVPVPISENKVVTGAPVDLLRNRPDIREAERTLAAATAMQGVAISNIYPKISLMAMFGLGSSMGGNFFHSGSKTSSVGIGVGIPFFDFGRIQANIDIADARQEQAFLNYKKVVLNALKEVENALVSYIQEKDRMELLLKTFDSQAIATRLIKERYRKGLVSFLDVLDAERSLYTSEISLAQSRANLSTNLIALYKALGGGWR